MKTSGPNSSRNRLPRLIDAIDLNDLHEILKIRSGRYPTNYLDLLIFENKGKTLSEIIELYQSYKAKNRDFKTVARINTHIKYRQNHDGWKF